MLTLENRTEAVLEAVGDRGEVLAMAHGRHGSHARSVVLVRMIRPSHEGLVVWWVEHGVSSAVTHTGEYFRGLPRPIRAPARAWHEFVSRAKRIGWDTEATI